MNMSLLCLLQNFQILIIQLRYYISMSQKVLKVAFLAFTGFVLFLLFSNPPDGAEPSLIKKFELDRFLTDIPNLNLNRLQNTFYVKLPQYTVQDIAVRANGDIFVAAGTGPSNFYYLEHTNVSVYKKIATTKGRVLGTALSRDQKLLAFADEQEGLKILDLETHQMKTVATQYQGQKFIAVNSVTFGSNADILYFTHSGRFSMQQYHKQLLYKQAKGQVFQLNLKTKSLRPILWGLHFTNGITYSQSQNCLYVVQLNLYRILKIQLSQNQLPFKYSVVIDNLIGYPDNLKQTQDGKLWIGIPSLRDPVNVLIDNQPLIRKALVNIRIPQSIFTKFANFKYAGGIKIDPKTGKVVDYFFGSPQKINFVTGITQVNNKIYMASIKHNLVGITDYI